MLKKVSMKIDIRKWEIFIFSIFLVMPNCYFGQTFLIFSNNKNLDSINVYRQNKQNVWITKNNFKETSFRNDDKILYNNELMDFSKSNDTIIIFDKTKEIDGVEIINYDLRNKINKFQKNNKNNSASADFVNNVKIATLVKFNFTEKSFLKSITLFPRFIENTDGILEIQILANNNGIPDNDNPILVFEKTFSDITKKKWEINFPRIIKYPKNGCFVAFLLKNGEKRNVSFQLNTDSEMLMYYPLNNEWKKIGFNGYHFKLKILQ